MPTEIVPDIYDITVRQDDTGRRYRAFLADGRSPTLFDAGFADTTDTLFDGIEAVGLTPERLVITHGDPDHIGGFDAVVERYDTETYVPEQTELTTEHGADYRYGHGDRIDDLEAVYVPGHSRDQYAFVDESAGVLIAADTVAGADLRGLPEGYLVTHPALYSADYGAAELNLERLLEYEFDAVLVYHGSSVIEDAQAVLDTYVNFPGRPDAPVK